MRRGRPWVPPLVPQKSARVRRAVEVLVGERGALAAALDRLLALELPERDVHARPGDRPQHPLDAVRRDQGPDVAELAARGAEQQRIRAPGLPEEPFDELEDGRPPRREALRDGPPRGGGIDRRLAEGTEANGEARETEGERQGRHAAPIGPGRLAGCQGPRRRMKRRRAIRHPDQPASIWTPQLDGGGDHVAAAGGPARPGGSPRRRRARWHSIARSEAPATCGDTTTFGSGEQRIVGRHRLLAEHVQPGAAEPAARERVHERRVVDERPARRVDEEGARLHAAELGPPDEATRLRAERDVEGHRVRSLEELVEARARLDAEPPEAVGIRRRRVAAHRHAEPRAGDPGGGAPDAPAPHDPERPARGAP